MPVATPTPTRTPRRVRRLGRVLVAALAACSLLGAVPVPAPATAAPASSTVPTSVPATTATQPCATPDFTDVAPGTTFYTAVTWLRCEGVSLGYPDGSYGVSRQITRGETAQLLFRQAGGTHDAGTKATFTDVAPGRAAFTAVDWMADHGYTQGYADGSFGVDDPISRGELAAFLFRMSGRTDYRAPATSPFPDLPVTSSYYRAAAWLQGTGFISGYADDTFRPSRHVTRGESAKFLYALESGLNGTPPAYDVPSRQPVADTNPTHGSGGVYRDASALTYSNGASTSQYHLYADHLDGRTPHGIIVHLHGDGALEYNRPEWTTVPAYLELAREHGLMLLVPRTPDRSGSITWWEGDASGRYAADLLTHLGGRYNLDLNRVYWTGYSGGAETITYKMLDAHSSRWTGGAAVIVAGGGASTWRQPTRPLPATLKSRFPLHWVVGSLDSPSAGGASGAFDAVKAARTGQAHYQQYGMRTSLTVVPGLDHWTIASRGPATLARILEGR